MSNSFGWTVNKDFEWEHPKAMKAPPLNTKQFWTSERFTSITLTVHISCNGQGMSKNDINNLAYRLSRCAIGRSKSRRIMVECGDVEQVAEGINY